MSATEQTIEVEAPIRTVYNQWTQFASFPKFMHGVERVDQKRDDLVHFVVRIGGHTVEYDAEITAQVPDKCVSWQSKAGRVVVGRPRPERTNSAPARALIKELLPVPVPPNMATTSGDSRRTRKEFKRPRRRPTIA